ncbi:MAG: phosphoribosylglycinamide formyltransferase [Coriobacteriaceae bacterium]|nr:phosphoribosylglycinamide formyltransferase [Coriobacteriaceae bacterium]
MSTLDDEYRRLIEEAGLPPEALPSDVFFSSAAEREVDRAKAEAFPVDELIADEQAVAASVSAWDGRWSTLQNLPAGHLDGNTLERGVAALRAEGGEPGPLPIGVLISGSGTNLQALIDRIADGSLNAEIKLVVASRPSAAGLKRAEEAGIQTLTLSKDIYADPIMADEIIAGELYRAGVAYVVMAGYMRKVHVPLLATFPGRVINLHPALLPSFPGARGIADAYERGVKVTGVTVHIANAAYDQGPIIAQEPVRVEEGWTLEQLEERIHEVEHELYPRAVQLLAEGRVTVRPDLTVEVAPGA